MRTSAMHRGNTMRRCGRMLRVVGLLSLLVSCVAPLGAAAEGLALLPSAVVGEKAPVSPGKTDMGLALDKEEQTLWNQLQAARAKAGLPVLALDGDATALARDRSGDMATRTYFGHVTPDGRSVFDMLDAYHINNFSAIGETIAMNWNVPDSGMEAAKGLFASPTHYEILFDKQFAATAAGVGHGVSRDGKQYYTIVIFKR